MAEGDAGATTREYRSQKGGGDRWYDPNRTVIGLLGLGMVLFLAWSGWVSATARGAETVNIAQEQRLQAIEKQSQKTDEKLDRMDLKIERLLEKAK